jgi:hypothetical protein
VGGAHAFCAGVIRRTAAPPRLSCGPPLTDCAHIPGCSAQALLSGWLAAREEERLGPIAQAARHGSSGGRSPSPMPLAPTPVAPSALCGHAADASPALSPFSVQGVLTPLPWPGAGGTLAAAQLPSSELRTERSVPGSVVSLPQLCATPIAAAAGGSRSASQRSQLPPQPSPRGSTPMDVASPRAAAVGADCSAGGALASLVRSPVPISSSVGAQPHIARAGQGQLAEPRARDLQPELGSPGAGASPSHLRARLVVSRARRHASAQLSASSLPGSSVLGGHMAGLGSLGASATLMQRELAARGAPPPPRAASARGARAGHASRRSFADLSELASVAELTPLEPATGPHADKRARRHGGGGSGSGVPASFSMGSLVFDLGLASLPEDEALLGGAVAVSGAGTEARGAGGGARRMRRSASGTGLSMKDALGSPVRGAHMGAGVRSNPQPIRGGGKSWKGAQAASLADSVATEAGSASVASDGLMR